MKKISIKNLKGSKKTKAPTKTGTSDAFQGSVPQNRVANTDGIVNPNGAAKTNETVNLNRSARSNRTAKPNGTDKLKKTVKSKGFVIGGIVIILGIVGFVLFMANNSNKPHEEVSINSDKAAEIDPTNYNMSDEEKKSYKDKIDELLGDDAEANMEKVYSYFTDEINKQLRGGNTEQACKILWVEHDAFMERSMPENALQALLKMDDTKLEKYQKIYLYRAIVTASVITKDKETEDKYTAMVIELDPPAAPISEDLNQGEQVQTETPAEGQTEVPQEQTQGQ